MAYSLRVVRSSFHSSSIHKGSLTVEALESRVVPNATIGPVTRSLVPDGTYLVGGIYTPQEQSPPLSIHPGPAMPINFITGQPPTSVDTPVSVSSGSGTESGSGAGKNLGVIPSGTLLLLAAGHRGHRIRCLLVLREFPLYRHLHGRRAPASPAACGLRRT